MITVRTAAVITILIAIAAPGHAGQVTDTSARSTPSRVARAWTLEDIVTVPQVADLILSRDEKSALYISRRADISKDAAISTLHLVDLGSKSDTVLLKAAWIDRLRSIPGSSDWSVLTDVGHGIQLYRIDRHGVMEPIACNNEIVPTGNVDGVVGDLLARQPLRSGILSYDWSPDGKLLWYSVLRAEKLRPAVLRDDAVGLAAARPRALSGVNVDFHVRFQDGRDVSVLTRPTSDRIARYLNGNPRWNGSEFTFFAEEVRPDGASQFIAFRWDADRQVPVRQDGPPQDPHSIQSLGPHGGRLDTAGFAGERALEETMPDGKVYSYGKVAFLVGDARSAGSWRSTDGSLALIGTRAIDHPAYGLQLVDARRSKALVVSGSVTKCDFSETLDIGVCVREAITRSPELVLVTPGRKQAVHRLISLSPDHDRIAPLRAEAQTWRNRLGYSATGFVVYPRNYVEGVRYPAIVVTHGSDADERFAHEEFQWNYPVQVFAEKGYVVILMNDPSPSQSAKLMAAYDEWGGAEGRVKPEEVQRLVWLNGVYSFEDAVGDMVRRGLVDPARVGIAGYSRGSQMVNVTMTQSGAFRAASSGDGGFLEPGVYPESARPYTAIFGGSPYSLDNLKRYQRLSPSLRAASANGPILQQMAAPLSGAIELFKALRKSAIPAQITLYPGETPAAYETHVFHIPSNRLAAMQENLAWFDFWLRGTETSDPAYADQYARWRKMGAMGARSKSANQVLQ